MKVIRNRFVPVKGFSAVNLFGVLFVRKGAKVTDVMIRHEEIHTMQMREMLYIFYYLWYAIEGAWKCLRYGKKGYYRISFEQEAYLHDHYPTRAFKELRRPFAWTDYLTKAEYGKGK